LLERAGLIGDMHPHSETQALSGFDRDGELIGHKAGTIPLRSVNLNRFPRLVEEIDREGPLIPLSQGSEMVIGLGDQETLALKIRDHK